MASPKCVFYLTCLFIGEMVQTTQNRFLSVQTGENVTLHCFFKDLVAPRLFWYKQTLGQKPKHVSTLYKYNTNGSFHAEFKNPRFTLDARTDQNHLRITDLQISDSATYYCLGSFTDKFDFMEAIVVSVEGSGLKVPALVHQSASESIQPGGSVTLNCTVLTGTCDGPHSVYWFKDSEESHPGLIYTHGGRNHQCERKPSTQTHTCVYNLPMKSLDLSHAGTYYCAVASCGHILFGDGTTLDFKDEDSLVSYLSSAALTFTSILSVLLALSVCVMNKGNSCQNTESQARCPAPSTANAKGHQQAEILYYAALSVRLHNGSRRQKDQTWSECVYHSVKQ
ncbi:uncharacterized protein [Clinocottus analis]|uniref:uncharacterized protein n=1 Tax=Clinocottus analis TaxID=304258 RepID=UPI0035C0B815